MNKKQKTARVTLKNKLHRHVKMAVVPHKANQYRPHLVRRYGIGLILLAVMVLQLSYLLPENGAILGSEAPISSQALLNDTNSERAKNNVKPLAVNETLSQAAYLKASDMFKKQYWAHVAPDGVTPWQWFNEVGYNYTYAGENLAKNFYNSHAVTQAWLSSPEHRANVLGSQYSEVGFAVASGNLEGKQATIIVALYGLPASTTVAGAKVAGYEQAPPAAQLGVLTRFGIALQSLSPALLASMILLLLVVIVAIIAHFYRYKLPKNLQNSWYKHHGLAKAGGVTMLGFIVLFLYGGGQI